MRGRHPSPGLSLGQPLCLRRGEEGVVPGTASVCVGGG